MIISIDQKLHERADMWFQEDMDTLDDTRWAFLIRDELIRFIDENICVDYNVSENIVINGQILWAAGAGELLEYMVDIFYHNMLIKWDLMAINDLKNYVNRKMKKFIQSEKMKFILEKANLEQNHFDIWFKKIQQFKSISLENAKIQLEDIEDRRSQGILTY